MDQRICFTEDGTEWTCVQAYAGLGDADDAPEAAQDGGQVVVVATPSGGEQTVRLRLAIDWLDALSDEALARSIEAGRH